MVKVTEVNLMAVHRAMLVTQRTLVTVVVLMGKSYPAKYIMSATAPLSLHPDILMLGIS
jgi:hypothetical protein